MLETCIYGDTKCWLGHGSISVRNGRFLFSFFFSSLLGTCIFPLAAYHCRIVYYVAASSSSGADRINRSKQTHPSSPVPSPSADQSPHGGMAQAKNAS